MKHFQNEENYSSYESKLLNAEQGDPIHLSRYPSANKVTGKFETSSSDYDRLFSLQKVIVI